MAVANLPQLGRTSRIGDHALNCPLLGRTSYDQITNPPPVVPHVFNRQSNLLGHGPP